MSLVVKATKLYVLRELAIEAAFAALKGTPVLDKDGQPIYLNGEILMLPPTPQALNVVRQMLKDNGIDREPIEADPERKALTSLIPADDEDPTLLE